MSDESDGYRKTAKHLNGGANRATGNDPDLTRLNRAITSLNDDAEGMHSLITRSADQLEQATVECKRAADLAGNALVELGPLTEELHLAIEDTQGFVTEASGVVESLVAGFTVSQKERREAFDSFAEASLKTTKELAAETDKAVGRLSASISEAKDSSRNAFESFATQTFALSDKTKEELLASISQAQDAGKEEFDQFTTASLKASEKTRDDLQTDLLSYKTAMSARMDSLEATTTRSISDLEVTVAKLSEDTKRIEMVVDEKSSQLEKKIALPLYVVIVVVCLQLLTLAALFLR